MTNGRALKTIAGTAVLAFLAGPLAAIAQESDRPTLRAKAQDEWFNESYGRGSVRGQAHRKQGGAWSPQFRQFMLDAAARERAKYGDMIPGAQSGPSAGASDPRADLSATGTTWVNLGPTKADVIKNGGLSLNKTDAGRVRSIVPVGSDLYVAFSGGGVWRRDGVTGTWTALTDGIGTLSTGALAANTTTGALYLGLGDPFDGTGIGFVTSTDGGATWSAPVYLGTGTDRATVTSDLLVVPGTTADMLLATTNKGLFRSTDSGASWSAVALTGTAAPYAWSLAQTGPTSFVAGVEGNYAATSGSTDGAVWRSTDNGATWARATMPTVRGGLGRITVESAPSNPNVVYAMAAKPNATTATDLADIFKSTDGGQTWVALGAAKKRTSNTRTAMNTLLNGQGWYDQLVMVDPANPNVAYFGGALFLAKTTDGGSTWAQKTEWLGRNGLAYVHADFHAGAFAGSSMYVGSDGGVFSSTDGGTTFSDALNVGIASHLVYNVGSSTANPSAVLGGFQDNGTRVRVASTSVFDQTIGGDGFGCDINPANASNMLGSLYYARIQKSTDGGASWVQSCTGIPECGGSNAPFYTGVVSWAGDATGNTVFTWSNAKAYKSANYASSWSALGTAGFPAGAVIRGFGVAKSNPSVLGAVFSGGNVRLSNNGGASWTTPAALPNHDLSLSFVHFDTTNPNTVYVASVAPNGAANHLWKSTDFGTSWQVFETGLPAGVPVNIVKNDPNDNTVLYAGTHLGVYRWTPADAQWVRYGAGMPLVNVTDVYVSPDSSLVRAATFGRGFWELQ
jgi:photosystem II stability/assembly factor-like uncharacterized protein